MFPTLLLGRGLIHVEDLEIFILQTHSYIDNSQITRLSLALILIGARSTTNWVMMVLGRELPS